MAVDLKPGEALGQYRVLRAFGIGGTAFSYQVDCPKDAIGPRFAKVFIQPTAEDAEYLPEVVQEFWFFQKQLQERLNRISFGARILDLREIAGHFVKVTELIPGKELSAELAHATPTSRWEIACQFCFALHLAHQAGVATLDLKPDNILVMTLPGGSRAVRMIDFDSGWVDCDRTPGKRFRRTSYLGTDGYFAPEFFLWRDDRPRVVYPELPADVFSAATVLFEIFSGRRLIAAAGDKEPAGLVLVAARKRMSSSPLPRLDRVVPRLVNPAGVDVARKVSDLLEEMLRFDPARRPTMRQVYERLEALRKEKVVAPPRPPTPPPPAKPVANSTGRSLELHVGGRLIATVQPDRDGGMVWLGSAIDRRWTRNVGRMFWDAKKAAFLVQTFEDGATLGPTPVPKGTTATPIAKDQTFSLGGVRIDLRLKG